MIYVLASGCVVRGNKYSKHRSKGLFFPNNQIAVQWLFDIF